MMIIRNNEFKYQKHISLLFYINNIKVDDDELENFDFMPIYDQN